MEGNKIRLILIVLAAVVLISAIGIAILYIRNAGLSSVETTEKSGFEITDTRQVVPEGIKAPGVGEEVSDKNVAVPTGITSVVPGSDKKVRTFEISASGGKFNPSTVIGNIGDTIHINFTAVDGNYDLTLPDYGMKQTAKKGEKKIFEFQAQNEGKFIYYCESCGGITSSAVGYIIIVK